MRKPSNSPQKTDRTEQQYQTEESVLFESPQPKNPLRYSTDYAK